jgi:hypothetical protein
MSTRPQFGRYRSLANKVAVGTTFNSGALYKEDFPHYSIQVDVTTIVGLAATATLQHSVDNVTFYDVGASTSIAAGGLVYQGTTGSPFMRVKITITAGTATIAVLGHAIA